MSPLVKIKHGTKGISHEGISYQFILYYNIYFLSYVYKFDINEIVDYRAFFPAIYLLWNYGENFKKKEYFQGTNQEYDEIKTENILNSTLCIAHAMYQIDNMSKQSLEEVERKFMILIMIRKRFFKNSLSENSRYSHRTSSLRTIKSVCFAINRNNQNELSYCVLMFSKLRNFIQHSNNHIVNRSFMQWWTVLPPTYKIFSILVLLSVALVGYLYVQKLLDISTLSKRNHTSKFVPNPEVHPPASASILHQFKNSAVCSDSAVCSKIGRLVNKYI